MGNYNFGDTITKIQLEQILNEKLKPLEENLSKLTKRDEDFKRKLIKTISDIHQRQELTLDGYDKIKEMADEWLGKD